MALPSSGSIGMAQVRTELGIASGSISLDQTDVRKLAGKTAGTISLEDLKGKSNITYAAVISSEYMVSVEYDDYGSYDVHNRLGRISIYGVDSKAIDIASVALYVTYHSDQNNTVESSSTLTSLANYNASYFGQAIFNQYFTGRRGNLVTATSGTFAGRSGVYLDVSTVYITDIRYINFRGTVTLTNGTVLTIGKHPTNIPCQSWWTE